MSEEIVTRRLTSQDGKQEKEIRLKTLISAGDEEFADPPKPVSQGGTVVTKQAPEKKPTT